MSLRGETRAAGSNGVVLVLIGLVLASVGGYMLTNEGRLTGEAVPVEATVVDAGVERTDDGRYYPHVEYAYEYEGISYAADTVYADGSRFTSADEARAFVDRHPPGRELVAYVDAEGPEQAHLIRDAPSPLYYLFVGGGGLALLLGGFLTADSVFRFGAVPRR